MRNRIFMKNVENIQSDRWKIRYMDITPGTKRICCGNVKTGVLRKNINLTEIVEDIEKWEKSFNVIDETKETTDNLKKLLAKYEIKGNKFMMPILLHL